MKLTYFIDNKLGGVTSLNYNLAANTGNGDIMQCVVNIDHTEGRFSKANLRFPVDSEIHFEYSSKDNYYSILRRLFDVIDDGEAGAFVLNYDHEMAMLDHYPTLKTTYQLVH